MIPSFTRPTNLIKIWILILFAFFPILFNEMMRVHPMGTKRSIAVRDGSDNDSSPPQEEEMGNQMEGNATKRLRRLPHVFNKVLELPFCSEADVTVEESSQCFRFIAEIDVENRGDAMSEIRAHAVEIHPGVTKIVVRIGDDDAELLLENLNVDTWRFRLPATARPELVTAAFVNGELIVTVPKADRGGAAQFEDVWGDGSRLVIVQ